MKESKSAKRGSADSRLTKKYFDEWAADYEVAFEKEGQEKYFTQKLINRWFRKKTFAIREKHLSEIIKQLKVKDKKILDIGCGTGQLALLAAKSGAQVTGWDISPQMIAICKTKAKKLGLKAEFAVKNLTLEKIPPVDIIFNIAVIEYYQDLAPMLGKMLASTRETLVLTDARYIWYRAILRKALSHAKNFPLFYHDPKKIIAAAEKSGFRLKKEYLLHSFRTFVFTKNR